MPPPNSSSFVLAISLGPVQDFIASARRCRDLWFGSWLLSEVSKAAALAIKQTDARGEDALIFPPPGTDLNPGSRAAVVNKLLALVSDPQACADAGRLAAQQRLDKMSDQVWQRLRGNKTESPIHEDVARAQIRDLLEWNWAAAPVENEDFALARRRAEALLAARKGCRDFGAVGWKLPGAFKSSLDGARESVLKPVITEQDELTLYEKFGLRKGELLDGVGLLKRLGERGGENENRVFSTSHVAAQGLLQRWKNAGHGGQAGRERVQQFESEVRALGLQDNAIGNVPGYDATFERRDAHLLFQNRLAAFFPGDKTKIERAQGSLQSLLCDLNDGRAVEPSPYYAIFVADGDKMGASISRATTLEKNQNLSRALSQFAQSARDCVEEARGSLIYAGGDDVLALVPLHSALPCARELHDRFGEVFQEAEFELDWLAPDFPTLSLGMAVVHHLEPLSEALFLARKAEKRAKAVDGKDALAVLVNKRSGSELLIADTWGTPETAGLDKRLQVFVDWAKTGEVAAGLAYEWRDLTLRVRLQTPPPNDPDNISVAQHNATVSEIHLSEAKRLAKRKRERGGERDVDERSLRELCDVLKQAKAKPNTHWLAHLADELIAAREFAAAITLATPETASLSPL